MNSTQKTILITGATSGIGKAAALKLAEMNHQIILISRNQEKLEETKFEIISLTNNTDIHIFKCDLANQRDIKDTAKKIKSNFPVIDVFVNNAGINTAQFELTADGIEKTFAVNHFACFLLTGLLLDNIKMAKQGRIINVSSNGHKKVKLDIEKIKNNEYQGRYFTYRRSKLANIMFTIDLAKRLKSTNVTVNSLHPGLIKTSIGKDDPSAIRKVVNFLKIFIAQSPDKGADTIVYLATSNKVKDTSGEYFINRRVSKTSNDSHNATKRKQLWELSENITKFKY